MEEIIQWLLGIEKTAGQLYSDASMRKVKENYFDLVISDVDMPKVSGFEFYEQAVAMDPELRGRFLFHTGGLTGETLDYLDSQGLPYLRKPARIEEIRETVRTMLRKQKYLRGALMEEK